MMKWNKLVLMLGLLGMVVLIVGCGEGVREVATTTTSTTTTTTTSTTTVPGDVNGDGYADVLIGADLANQAYLFLGGETVDTSPDMVASGADDNDSFGSSTAIVGDVNGNNYSDLLIGAFLADGGGDDRGQAYLFYGSLSVDNTIDLTFTGGVDDDGLGVAVSSAGDVNGDGFNDIIVGADRAAGGGTSRGEAYIYYGGLSMDNIADVTITGGADGDRLGGSVSGAGDVNGDGYDDVIVGADRAAGGGTSRGEAYIYYGGLSMDNIADVKITGAADGDNLGVAVSSAGDVNGDGYNDIIVGADRVGTDRGEAYIYFGGDPMNNVANVTITGGADGDRLGGSVSGAGDVNGDGYDDVIVGANQADGGGSDRGQAYIYNGGVSMDDDADVTITGGADDDYLGWSVSGAGDINGDGYDDVIIGAPGGDGTGTNRGEAYIYFGGEPMDNVANVTFSGVEDDGYFGISVAGVKP